MIPSECKILITHSLLQYVFASLTGKDNGRLCLNAIQYIINKGSRGYPCVLRYIWRNNSLNYKWYVMIITKNIENGKNYGIMGIG